MSQGLLQGTYTAGMGVDLKFIFQEDIRQSSLLLHKMVFRPESELKLHDCCYSDFLNSLVENELKKCNFRVYNLKIVSILLPYLVYSSYCLLISAFHCKLKLLFANPLLSANF